MSPATGTTITGSDRSSWPAEQTQLRSELMPTLLAANGGLFDFKDRSGNFSVGDVFLTLVTSFGLGILIAYTYRATHKGISYSQSFVQTLVILSMVVSVVMLIIGSNLARAFSLVGALSIIRFRN